MNDDSMAVLCVLTIAVIVVIGVAAAIFNEVMACLN